MRAQPAQRNGVAARTGGYCESVTGWREVASQDRARATHARDARDDAQRQADRGGVTADIYLRAVELYDEAANCYDANAALHDRRARRNGEQ